MQRFIIAESIHSGTVITAIIQQGDQLSAAALCNHPESSGFTILPLQFVDTVSDSAPEEKQPSTYSIGKSENCCIICTFTELKFIDTTFSDIWLLTDKSDPRFGNITTAAPVNTNHLAIGYGKSTKKWRNSHMSSIHQLNFITCRIRNNLCDSLIASIITLDRNIQLYRKAG